MCGIAGAYGLDEAAYLVSLMLKTMQHRGQDSAGIVSSDGSEFHDVKGFGLVDEVFKRTDFSGELPGRIAIGHLRYATTGSHRNRENIQPLTAEFSKGRLAIAHNGNLTDCAEWRRKLEADGSIFRSTSDTEIILHLMARSASPNPASSLIDACCGVNGSYALLAMTPSSLIAGVDPYGFRPLVRAPYKGGWLFASETCAFDIFGAPNHIAVETGSFQEAAGACPSRRYLQLPSCGRHCSFEHIYFSRPDSEVFGVCSNSVRERLGESLAAKDRPDADLVVPVPDSSNAMALAYARASGIPFRFGLIRNHYTGRTFISPMQTARELGVRMKLNAVTPLVRGRKVVVVDDSLVRGTTMKKVAALLRDAGAGEVHVRVASPPVIHPCRWGISMPTFEELAASRKTVEELRSELGLDSLAYLTVDDLRAALFDAEGERYCTTCFTGVPPTEQ